ncbi:hypothetical protein PENTCL1PPCAC_22401 [Pristionchus entomophagus]|uniref:Ankyrin repeat-containing protein n=1 Tax=Pristionchus entomophagus TaxID=358040 RepID=A0AAV5U123_9BILA|nr:hypothetical protein PENTCL1PPCAC_22401 [Pristionchus entomophagus]
MLSVMVERAQGNIPLPDKLDVDLAIVQMREEIVIWMSKDLKQASFLKVEVTAVKEQENSIERAAIQAVKKLLPSPSWRFSFIIPRSSRSSDRPLVCLTIPRESSLDGFAHRCEAYALQRIYDDNKKEKKYWRDFYSTSTMDGAIGFMKWLKEKERAKHGFTKRLFSSPMRVITSCSHNPGLPLLECIRFKTGTREMTAEQRENTVLISKKLEKICPSPVIFFNPLFNTDYAYAGRNSAGDLRIIGSDGGGAVKYEMHKAAKENDGRRIELLFSSGYDLNLLDESGFAPIHYATFLGNQSALGALIHSGCDVNISNKVGSSPLHLAIMGVQPFVVELLLLHPKINRSSVDSHGCTPFDLGMKKKQNSVGEELGKLLFLLEFLEESPKILVTFPDRSSAMMKMKTRKDTRAHDLLFEVLSQDTAMKATPDKAKELKNYFSIWLMNGQKAVQLDENELPARLATVWESEERETSSIEIRRNQLMTRDHERKTRLNQRSQTMLVHEIEHYFKEGWLDTSREDAIYMAVHLPPRMGQGLAETLERLPNRYVNLAQKSADERNRLLREIEKEYSLLDRNLSYTEREGRFLAKARKWPTYGCRPFECVVDYIMPRSDTCGFLGANDDGVHVYTFDQELFCTYPWDNFSFFSTSSQDGSTVIQFDQYTREVTFTALVHDSVGAASILRLCDHFSRLSRESIR